jgi:hypothetical protein
MQRTYTDFVYLLREVAPLFPWFLTEEGELRAESYTGPVCPLTAVCAAKANSYWDPASFADAAHCLGIAQEIANIITAAADLFAPYNAHVRADLVDAVGITEHWAPEGRGGDPAFRNLPYPHMYDRPIR